MDTIFAINACGFKVPRQDAYTAMARVFILNDLFVHERARRKGVASLLLAALEGYAWAHGAVRIALNVTMDNTPGQELYEAQGWSKDAQFFMYHRYPDG